MMEQLNVSERRVCRALNQPRSAQRYRPKIRASEERLVEQMIDLEQNMVATDIEG